MQKLSNTSKVLIAVIILLLGAMAYTYFTLRNELTDVIENSGTLERDVEHWRDEAGRSNARVETATVLFEELKNSNNEALVELRKDVKDLKNFVSQLKVDITTLDSLALALNDTMFIIGSDTIRTKSFNYKDNWLTLNGVLLKDSVKIDYEMRNKFQVNHEWMRQGLFKPKILNLTVRSENPNSAVGNVQEIRVRPNKPVWFETRGFQLSVAAMFGYYMGQRNN